MIILDTIVEVIANMLRTLLVEQLSERVLRRIQGSSASARLRGMAAVRRHIHRQCRRRLLNRLSTAASKNLSK
jgi:hypothetical protein